MIAWATSEERWLTSVLNVRKKTSLYAAGHLSGKRMCEKNPPCTQQDTIQASDQRYG